MKKILFIIATVLVLGCAGTGIYYGCSHYTNNTEAVDSTATDSIANDSIQADTCTVDSTVCAL